MPSEIPIRRWTPDDPLSEITRLLNAAYAELADMGLRFVATWQDDDITLERLRDGEAWLALDGEQIVGVISFIPPGLKDHCPWYAREGVSVFSQFGVWPDRQGQGIGSALLEKAEQRARDCGAGELACDTAESACDLIAWYEQRGYRFIEYADWEITNYRSVILSKTLGAT